MGLTWWRSCRREGAADVHALDSTSTATSKPRRHITEPHEVYDLGPGSSWGTTLCGLPMPVEELWVTDDGGGRTCPDCRGVVGGGSPPSPPPSLW